MVVTDRMAQQRAKPQDKPRQTSVRKSCVRSLIGALLYTYVHVPNTGPSPSHCVRERAVNTPARPPHSPPPHPPCHRACQHLVPAKCYEFDLVCCCMFQTYNSAEAAGRTCSRQFTLIWAASCRWPLQLLDPQVPGN